MASVNYRLSPYPSHPTDPSSPEDGSRTAQHPAHIKDVLTAIAWLQMTYDFGENYLLVGHSCGATLALQAIMRPWTLDTKEFKLKLPIGVVGIEGIYDLALLVKTHSHPIYREFVEGAFGDPSNWEDASPTSAMVSQSWLNGKIVVLAHSSEDELVDWAQTEAMCDQLWKEKRSSRRDTVIKLKGNHDVIWEEGKEMAKAIELAFEMLDSISEVLIS